LQKVVGGTMDDKKWNEYVHEAKILQFPRKKTLRDDDMNFIIALEEELHTRLIRAHDGRPANVPLEVVGEVNEMIDRLEELLRS